MPRTPRGADQPRTANITRCQTADPVAVSRMSLRRCAVWITVIQLAEWVRIGSNANSAKATGSASSDTTTAP